MSSYRSLLQAYLADPAHTQSALAEAIGMSQAAVNRYANNHRFPDAETARKIDKATAGRVSFAVWQSEMAARIGLEPAQAA